MTAQERVNVLVQAWGSGRAAPAALALVMLTLALLASVGAFMAYRATQRVMLATQIHESYDHLRHDLLTEEALLHEFLRGRQPEAQAELVEAAAHTRKALESILRDDDRDDEAFIRTLQQLREEYVAVLERSFTAADAGDELTAQLLQQEAHRLQADASDRVTAFAASHVATEATSRAELEQITTLLWLGTPMVSLVGLGVLFWLWTGIQAHQRWREGATNRELEAARRTERALAKREAQLAEAQRLAHVGSWDRDLLTNQVSWSDELWRILGLESMVVSPSFQAFLDRLHPDDVERVRLIVEAAIHNGEPVDCQARGMRPDGEMRVIHSRGAALNDAAGRPVRMVGSVQDITERSRIDEAFQESERSLQALVGSLDDVVFEFDGEGTYVNIWVRDESLLALPRESLLGRRVTDVLGGEIGSPYLQLFKRVLATGQSESLEYSLEVGAGKRWFLASISAVQRSNGEHRTVSMLSRDITERKRVEAELFQAQKLEAVGRLASGIAHEINTPIQFIGDNVHFLSDGFGSLDRLVRSVRTVLHAAEAGSNGTVADRTLIADLRAAEAEADLDYLAEEIPRAIGQTLDGVKHVASIVRAMKEFAHPDGSERVTIDLNHALLSTLTVARSELKYLADVETDLADLPPVPCHPSAINQVLLNLLVNAAHAIADRGESDRGTIRVRTARDGDDVLVEIADSGCGIPDDIKGQVFDQFFTTKGVGRGTGQGLALARRIVVEQHGGSLSFESEVGRGTTFSVRLPLNTHAPARANGVALGSR